MHDDELNQVYGLIARKLLRGKVVPVLGAGVNLSERPPEAHWQRGTYLPSAAELADELTVALTHQHGDLVNDVRFLPGGNGRLVSASDDRTVAVWSCPACDNQQQVIDDALAGP